MMSKNDQSRTQRQNPRYSDVTDEPIMRRLSPIEGYKVVSLVSLENAIAPVSKFFNGIENYVSEAKENCKSPADGLNQDESASIYLYTMQFDAGPSLYTILNATLRRENRDSLKPWFFFLKLFLTALSKLPSCAKTVWRGVRDVDLGFKYPTEKKFVWWGISSCTLSIDILESNSFFGTQGVRTLFSIECTDGKLIGSHSYYKNREQEVILMPGSHFEVRGQLNPTGGLHIIQLKQTDSPIVLRNSYPIKKFPISKPTPTPSSGRKLGLIILGNSGVGKSFLANILLDEEAFVHKASPQAVTTETEFKEINMGNETYAIFNIPGLIEADQKRIDTNIVEIHKAFSERPTSLILYVFGSQSGRIRDEDVVAFNALNKAYSFKLESLVLIFNGLPKDRPKNYEGEAIVLLKELIKVPCRTLCFLDAINKNDRYERQKLKNKLLQVIVERTAHLHQKKQDIELERDEVYKAKAQIKHLQAAFRENKQMYEEKIKEQQKVYDDMFIKIRNENEHIRRLVERQAEEARELKKQMDEQQAANKREQEQRDAKHQEKILKMQQKHERAIREANERAAQQITQEERRAKLDQLRQRSEGKDQNRLVVNVRSNTPQNGPSQLVQSRPMVSALLPIPQPNVADSIFVNGPWQNRYTHYGVWHGPFQHSMIFNPFNNTINGYGVDDVGEFALHGSYSKNTLQITIVQSYKLGTGNPTVNMGHQSHSTMTWNYQKRTFEGAIYGMVNGSPMSDGSILEMSPAHVARA